MQIKISLKWWTSSGHLQISVRYEPLKYLWNKDFFNLIKFEFLVKNDRSAVDIRNRPRIPVPDEVKAFDDDAHDDDYDLIII